MKHSVSWYLLLALTAILLALIAASLASASTRWGYYWEVTEAELPASPDAGRIYVVTNGDFSDVAPCEPTTNGTDRVTCMYTGSAWVAIGDGNTGGAGSGAPTTADYLVGTVQGGLSAEIVVGTSPGGELGGTWATPTVDSVHSGSAHHTVFSPNADPGVDHASYIAGHSDGANCTTTGEWPAGVDGSGVVQGCGSALPANASPVVDGQITWDSTTESLKVGDDGVATLEFVSGAHTTASGITMGGDISSTADAAQVDDVQSATTNTEAADNSTTQVASTAFVQQEINGAGGTNLSCASGQCNVDDAFLLLAGDTSAGAYTLTGDWDFGGGGIEVENGTTPPGCTEGQLFFDTDATSGQRLLGCEGGTFVLQGDGGGGGAMPDEVLQFPAAALSGQMAADDSFPAPALDQGTNWDVHTLLFDDTTDECAGATFNVTGDIDTSGTVTFVVYWYAVTAATANVVWDVRHAPVAGGESWDAAQTTESSGAQAANASQDLLTKSTWTETVTNLAWAAGDMVLVLLCRDANHATGDTLTGDAAVIQLSIEVPRA